MNKSNTIVIKGETFYYVIEYLFSEYGQSADTLFYKEEIISFRKKYFFFGKLVESRKPEILFRIGYDIEDSFQTKKFMRDLVHKEYYRYKELIYREKEIANGELI